MAQQLRVLVALVEDLDLGPSTLMAAHNYVSTVPGEPTSAFFLLMNFIHTKHTHLHAGIKVNKFIFRSFKSVIIGMCLGFSKTCGMCPFTWKRGTCI